MFANFLKLKSEMDNLNILLDSSKPGSRLNKYQANDMVSFNGGKSVGVVL